MNKESKEKKSVKLSFDLDMLRKVQRLFCDNKSNKDHVGWLRAFITYLLIMYWQIVTKGVGFGKYRKTDVYKYFEEELKETRPHIVIGALIRAGFVVWGRGEYKGKRIYCLQSVFLNSKYGKPVYTDEEDFTYVESEDVGNVEPLLTNPKKENTLKLIEESDFDF